MAISEERGYYQQLIKDQCSDNHWREVCKRLKKNKLEVTKQNIQFYVSIKEGVPRSAIGIDNILRLYSEVTKICKGNKVEVTGSEIYQMITLNGILPPQPTLSRWFSSVGGYKKGKKYTAEQFRIIMLKALIYKSQYQTENRLVGE